EAAAAPQHGVRDQLVPTEPAPDLHGGGRLAGPGGYDGAAQLGRVLLGIGRVAQEGEIDRLEQAALGQVRRDAAGELVVDRDGGRFLAGHGDGLERDALLDGGLRRLDGRRRRLNVGHGGRLRAQLGEGPGAAEPEHDACGREGDDAAPPRALRRGGRWRGGGLRGSRRGRRRGVGRTALAGRSRRSAGRRGRRQRGRGAGVCWSDLIAQVDQPARQLSFERLDAFGGVAVDQDLREQLGELGIGDGLDVLRAEIARLWLARQELEQQRGQRARVVGLRRSGRRERRGHAARHQQRPLSTLRLEDEVLRPYQAVRGARRVPGGDAVNDAQDVPHGGGFVELAEPLDLRLERLTL